LLLLGLLGSRLWIRVTAIPKNQLYPLILSVSVIGSFAVRNSMFDIVACLGFGCLGWILRRYRYPVAPIILGMVLGGIAETKFRQAVLMGGYNVFWDKPACRTILIVSVLSLLFPVIRSRFTRSG
jgi:putative tricarboxylic transport membrane protein